MPKYIIIFGAGASFSAGPAQFGFTNPIKGKLPALGNRLFDDLREFDRANCFDGKLTWGGLSDSYSKMFNTDFEQGMAECLKTFGLPSQLQRTMAEYFFNFSATAGKDNLYVRLGEFIRDASWDGAIVTLNYERLLEQSLTYVGLQPFVGSAQKISDKKIELCFPHGCCHIFCDGVRSSGAVLFGTGVTTSGVIKVISDPKEFFPRIHQDSFPPVMSYFEPNKRTVAGGNFIESQRKRLKELISGAEQIVIVGMKVRPDDRHIWEPLADTKGRIIYCGKNGVEEFNRWSKEKNRGERGDLILKKYFNEAFDEICNYLGLRYVELGSATAATSNVAK
jgi:hypothetical protein